MLKGIKVLQFEGLAPTLFCGMYFADQGAQVIMIARKDPAPFSMQIQSNIMNRGKKCFVLSPKIKKDRQLIQQLIKASDIIIDPYRPGVLEKLNLGPNFIFKFNKKAILLRVSGYGQQGLMAQKPGHDLNYISSSGIVPLINMRKQSKIYQFPTNYLADFVSCSLGITATLCAIAISRQTGLGRIIDCSMTDGCIYYSKIIDETYDMQEIKKDNRNQNIVFIRHGASKYCVKCFQQKPDLLINQIQKMSRQNIKYLKTGQFQISQIEELSNFESQVMKLKNPFDNNPNLKGIQIPRRGEHNPSIQQILNNFNKPKL